MKHHPGPPPNSPSPPRAPHRRRELLRPPCWCPWLLLRSTTAVPLQPNRATTDNPLQPSSDSLNPTPSTVPPSASSSTARTPPVTPTSTCRRLFPPPIPSAVEKTSSELLPSLQLLNRSITPPACSPATPLPPTDRPDFVGNSPVPTGEKASPVLSRAERLRWARPLRSGWAEHCRGSPDEQCCLLFFLQINSIHSKSNSNF
jgi:hypothetical protein